MWIELLKLENISGATCLELCLLFFFLIIASALDFNQNTCASTLHWIVAYFQSHWVVPKCLPSISTTEVFRGPGLLLPLGLI